MTPSLSKHSETLGKVVAFYFNIGFQKSLGNLNFGFDSLATVRFGFLKTETEPTLENVVTNNINSVSYAFDTKFGFEVITVLTRSKYSL
jgi:hypothetical protein